MACQNNYCLCNRIVISDSVTFADGTLLIDIPAGSYANREKYCIVVAQEIPETTTIGADVAITIGGDTATTYPLVNSNCTNVSACKIRTRMKYATRVFTNIQSGVFKLVEPISCCNCPNYGAPALPIAAPTETTQTGGGN